VITKLKACFSILFLSLVVLGGVILLMQPARAAGQWYVAPSGDDGNACTSPGASCATINGAIGKASSGDTIFVATGTYTGGGYEVVLIDKNITLSGGWEPGFTAQTGTSSIDGEEARRGMYVNPSVTATVDRFTVQNGYTDDGNGGGIYNSGTMTMTNSTVKNNFAEYSGYGSDRGGGGIYTIGTLTLINSTVNNNTASSNGGGIYSTDGSSTVILDSQIYANTAIQVQGGGVGMDYSSALNMSRSLVVGNAAQSNDAGGISSNNGSATYIENSIIAGNFTDGTGGGLGFFESGPNHIFNSHIVGNEANYDGAAIVGFHAQIEITNTLVISNIGYTGIDSQWDSDAVFLLSYCDTYGNSPDGTENVTITRTNCLGTPPEDGLDPLMVGGALPSGVGPTFADQWMNYDYHLQSGSPLIDTGTPVGAPATDIDGQARPFGIGYDIGADEFMTHFIYLYLPLVLNEYSGTP
jgi:parallel beta-helix repeat protein